MSDGTAPAVREAAVDRARLPWRPLAVALALALACAIVLPAYSGPDEMAHVAYVAALAHGHLPVMPNGEFANIATGTTWQAQHPPLFYILGAPLYLGAGGNTEAVLYLMRLLSIAGLLATIVLIDRVARMLLPPDRAGLAAWIVAVHPTVVYVSSMVNNEAWAMAFAVACVWAALKARQSGDTGQSAAGNRQSEAAGADERQASSHKPQATSHEMRWLLAAAAFGGLALLTKLTAIAGVVSAAVILAQAPPAPRVTRNQEPGTRNQRRAGLLRAGALLVGAIALWLPWGLLMQRMYGSYVPSPIQRPAFSGGLMALTIDPLGAALFIGIGTAEFAIGLVTPYWLMEPIKYAHVDMIVVGWIVVLAVGWICCRRRELRFVGAAFLTLLLLVLNHILFRDGYAIIFLARYSPIATVLAALLAASALGGLRPAQRIAALAVLGLIAAAGFAYVAWFFSAGSANGGSRMHAIPNGSTAAPRGGDSNP
ncbi:MAG TPA: hypothetical protein VKT77_12890 [Chthonomonadaceae bacterium]|nr:hypothetical protein [Chthonomonadaceae bacterium]